jgi:hypothetical protein
VGSRIPPSLPLSGAIDRGATSVAAVAPSETQRTEGGRPGPNRPSSAVGLGRGASYPNNGDGEREVRGRAPPERRPPRRRHDSAHRRATPLPESPSPPTDARPSPPPLLVPPDLLLLDHLPLAAAPPPAHPHHAWAALPFLSAGRGRGGPARSGGPPLPRKPRRGAGSGPEAGRRPVRLIRRTARGEHIEINTRDQQSDPSRRTPEPAASVPRVEQPELLRRGRCRQRTRQLAPPRQRVA